jgi:ubiquitin carboxyl-terminal hydrolase 7
VKVITEESFKHHRGTDLTVYDAISGEDLAAPKLYKERRATQTRQLLNRIATDLGIDSRRVRLWTMVNRVNKTIRPGQPIVDLLPTVDETFKRTGGRGSQPLWLWAEAAETVDAKGNAVWPSNQGQPTGVGAKNNLILLFLKRFDADEQALRGVCHVYISREKMIAELIPIIMKKMGWGERIPPGEKILLWEVGLHSATWLKNF